MPEKAAGKDTLSTLGACADLPLDAQLAEAGGAARESIVARLTSEMDVLNRALPAASPVVRNELILLVECLRAARQVVERSASFKNARDKS